MYKFFSILNQGSSQIPTCEPLHNFHLYPSFMTILEEHM